MSCLLDNDTRRALRIQIAGDLKDKVKSETPFDIKSYIKEIYELFKTASQDEALSIDAARLVPTLALQLLSVNADLKAGMRKLDKTIGSKLDEIELRYEDISEVQKDLGLDIDPKEQIEAADEILNKEPEPQAEPVETVDEAFENNKALKKIPFGAFFTYGPEFENYDDPSKPNYLVPKQGEKRNYAAMRFIDSVLKNQIAKDGIEDSGQMDLPGVGKVFLKIVHAATLDPRIKQNFPGFYFNQGEAVALVVDEKGNTVNFSENGQPDEKGKPVIFKVLTRPATTPSGELALDAKSVDAYLDRQGIDRKQARRYKTIAKQISEKIKALAKQKRDADSSLTPEQATKQATQEINESYQEFFKMLDYVVANPKKSVEAVMTGVSSSFVMYNNYNLTNLSDISFDQGFQPFAVTQVQAADSAVKENLTYFTYPGINEPIIINNPPVAERPDILNTILSLFTDDLFVMSRPKQVYKMVWESSKERISAYQRNKLIEQYMLNKYSKVGFMAEINKETGELKYENEDGSLTINVNGTRYKIKFDGTPEAKASQEEARAAIETFLKTPTKGAQITKGFETVEAANKTAKQYSANIVTDLKDAKKGSVLKEGDKYYEINLPKIVIVGSLISQQYDKPTISVDAQNNKVLSTEKASYNDFVKNTFLTSATQVEGKIRTVNPVMSYGPTLQGYADFTQGEEKEEAPKEEVKEEVKPDNTQATQVTPNDMSIDDLYNSMDTIEKKTGQKIRNKKLSPQEQIRQDEMAKAWYAKSPLAQHIPYEVMKRIMNTSNPDGPVAEWSVHGIILYHYYSEDGKFNPSKSADYTDLYHEAWHGFTQTFLTEEQRTKLYGEVRKRAGSFTDYTGKLVAFKEADVWQLEEFLAEEFREYMMSGGKMIVKGAPQRNTIFRKILNILKALFSGASVSDVANDPMSYNMVKELYDNLRDGNLSSYNFDINNRDKTIGVLNKTLVARTKVENKPGKLGYEDSMMLVKIMDSMMSTIANDMNKLRSTYGYTSQLMSTAKNRKTTYELVKRKMQEELIPSLEKEKEAAETDFLKNQIQQRIDLIQYAVEQFGDTQDLSKNKDGKGLIAFHAAKSKFLALDDKIEALEEESEDDTQEEENVKSKDNKFGSSGNEVSQYDLAAPEVKYLLRSIHKFDEKNNPEYVIGNIQDLYDASVIWNKIARALNGEMTITGMYKKLDEAAYKRDSKGNEIAILDPAIKALLEKLGPIPSQTSSAAETNLWINFYQTFNMVNIPLVQMTVTENKRTVDGITFTDYSMTIGAANTASRQALNLWRNSFASLNTDYIKIDENNRNYLDTKKVIEDFKDPATGRLKAGKAFDFLRAIGVRLSDKGKIREGIEKNIGAPAVLFEKLKTLADPDGRNLGRLQSFDALFESYPEEGKLKGLNSDTANLTALTELETRYSDFASNYSVTNAKGNMQFEQSLQNSMSIMVNSINKAEDVTDAQGNIIRKAYDVLLSSPYMAHLDIDKNPFAASSLWLNSVFMLFDENGNRYPQAQFGQKRIINGQPIKLELSNLSGVQMVTENGSDGIDSAGADEFTKLIMDFHMQVIANKPELMRHADKGTSFSVWLNNVFGGAKNKKTYADITSFYNTGTEQDPNIEGYENIYGIIKNYIDAEIKRMAKMRQMKEAIKNGEKVNYDANYINEGQNVLIFESILEEGTKTKLKAASSFDQAIKNNPELESEIKEQLQAYFEGQVADVEALMNKNKTKFIDKSLVRLTQIEAAKKQIPRTSEQNTEKALLRSFIVNNWIHNVESMNVIYGDIAQYNMAKEEFHKRNAGAGSTGNLLVSDPQLINYVNAKGRLYAKSKEIPEKNLSPDGRYDSAIMADNKIASAYLDEIKEGIEDTIRTRYTQKLANAKGNTKELAKLEKEIADKVKEATKAYTKMDEGDAQGWITFDFYRAASILEGKWSNKQEKMYKDICNGVEFTPEEVSQFFPTKKYQYWGPIQTDKDQLPVMGFHKFSLLPLIPTVIKGTNLEKLHEKMMKDQVDYALFKSGSKIATITKTKYNEKTDLVEADQDKFYTKDRDFDTETSYTKNTAFIQFLKNQLEIAPKYKRKVTFPTQMRKLIENGLYENGQPLKPEYEELVQAYEEDLALLTEKKKKALEKEAGIERDAKGKIVFNEKLRKFIIAELERQDLADHEIAFIKQGPGKNKLAHDLSLSLSSQKLEKVLASIVIKRLVKQKFNGEGLIQVSGAGWETNLRGKLTAEEILKYNSGTNELPFYKREVLSTDKNGKKTYGKTQAMKVKIALQGDFVKLLGLNHNDGKAIGTLQRLNEMLKDETWLNTGDHRKMISITGPRIPTQENNSMEFAEVFEFLPKEAGNIVVLPSEIVAKSGGDFDIDKITFMMPNIKSSPNYEDIDFKALAERFPDFSEEGIRTIFENRKDETRSEEEQEVLDAIYDSAPKNVTLPFDQTTEAGLENRVLDHMRKILELKELYSNLVRPNDTDLIKPIADELESEVSDYSPRTVEYKDKDGKTAYRIPGNRVFEIQYNLYKHGSNSIGKQTLGLGAVDNTYNTIFNRIGARLNAGYTSKNNVYRKLDLLLPHNTLPDNDGNETISLSHLYDVEGTSISSVIAQMINGWVDIAKDAWIFNVQGNKEIAPTLLFMVQAGIPVRQAVYYVSHPLIRQYVTEQKMAKSNLRQLFNKGGDNPMFYKNEARAAMFNMLYGDKTAKALRSGKEYEQFLNKKMDGTDKTEGLKKSTAEFFDKNNVQENLLKKITDYKAAETAGEPFKYDQNDEAIFLHFLEMEDMAKGLRDIKMSTNVDTSRTNSIFEAESKLQKLEAAEFNKMFPDWLVPRIKSASPIGSFFIQDFQIDFLKELFPLKANDAISEFLYYKTKDFAGFKDAQEKTFGDAEMLVNTFRNDLPAFIFQNALRKSNVLETGKYRGVLLNRDLTVKTIPSLKFGVFVKEVDGKPVIYIDKDQLISNSKNLANADYTVKLADGTEIKTAPVGQEYFDSPDSYYTFVMERELIRFRYKNKLSLMKERLDFKTNLERLMVNEPRLENETDTHFEARMNTMAFEETIRDMALDNTFNMVKMFRGRNTVADQLVQLQVAYPELMDKYSVVRNLAASFDDKGKERVGNIMLNDSLLDADKLNVFHQNLLELSNAGKIQLNTESQEEKERVASFFRNFATYAFLQSGMNAAGRYSLIRLVPQTTFTQLMTTYLEGETIDGVQKPGFLQNINALTLERYWKKFLDVNARTNRYRSRFKDYTLKPEQGRYNPAADKRDLQKVLDSEEFGKKGGDRNKNKMDAVKTMALPVGKVEEKKPVAKTTVQQVTFSEDANGNMLYDGKNAGLSTARQAVAEKPGVKFVINGTASIEGKNPNLSSATNGEAALLDVSKGASTVNFPTRKSFTGKDFALTDVTPDGKPVESKPAEKKPVTDKFGKKNIFTVTPIQTADKKAKIKASIATQFIGFGEGITGSSTETYRQQAGSLANTGNYSASDVVFVSIPGKRGDAETAKREQDKTIKEAIKAVEAGATILTDNKAYTDASSYNTGEKRLYDNMNAKGYQYSEITVDGQVIGTWRKATTPTTQPTERKTYSGKVTSLQPNQIFVFGSNPEGRHGAGAAKYAKDNFGAIYGQGEGLQGQSYALPTKDLRVKENKSLRSISPEQITSNIKTLYIVARENPTKEFLVSDYSETNLNGYTGQEMANMFINAGPIPSNIVFNENFDKLITTQPAGQAPVSTTVKTISTPQKPINIYSDGSDIKGTGRVGFGAVYEYQGKEYALSGTEEGEDVKELQKLFPNAKFSNPTMEMLALVKTLETFQDSAEHISIFQDYKGAVNYNELWNYSEGSAQREPKPWKAKEDYIIHLVERATAAIKKIESNGGSVKLNWVKGHAGNKMNDRADFYAKSRDNMNNLKDATIEKPLLVNPINTASSIDNTVTTSMKDDSKTIQPVPGNVVNPDIAKQIDAAIDSMKAMQAAGEILAFPKTGIGQYMIGANELTGELPSGKITPIAPATFVYLSQKLWDNFKYANPNFDVALGYMGMTNVLQQEAEVSDLDVMEALSICFNNIIP